MDLTDKYNHYKSRFYRYFIVVDHYSKSGSNLPAFVRQLWGKDSGFICWGDTTITMSYYIMYLASEYYNYKKDNNKNASETLKRLYYALKSIERLDANAEFYYKNLNFWTRQSTPLPSDLNGFFIRDDVMNDYLDKYPHIKMKDEFHEVDKVDGFESMHMLWNGEKNFRLSDMSQDQVWHLLQGFAFVKRIFEIEGSQIYQIDNEKVDIVKLCIDIPKRMLDYMLITCKQRIKNPVYNLPVPRGDDVRLLAYGFAKVGKYLTGYNYLLHLKWYNKVLYKTAIWFSENILYNGLSDLINKVFKKVKWLQIPIKNYSYRSLAVSGNVSFGNNLERLFNKDALNGEYLHFPYVYSLLHGGKIDEKIHDITLNRLKSAPDTGPFNFGKENRSLDIRWTSPDTLTSSIKCKELGDNVAHLGNYNGLDFLLLYNLRKMFTRNDNV